VRFKGSRYFYVWIGFWVALFVATHRRIPRGFDFLPARFDLVVHFVLYFVLTVLGWTYIRSTGRRTTVRTLLIWAVVYVGYAAFDEWLQQYVGRTTSLTDWLADTAGIGIATAILALNRNTTVLSRQRTPPE